MLLNVYVLTLSYLMSDRRTDWRRATSIYTVSIQFR